MSTGIDKCLFLLGGPKACHVAAYPFVKVATIGAKNHILYLVQDKYGWEK